MKKRLAILIAILLAINVVLADSNKYEKVGLELKKLGVISGDENGKLMEYSNLTREQSLVILARMMGEEKNAKATNYNTGFTDIKKGNVYTPFIEYAKLRGWTSGISKTEFGFGKSVSTKSMASFMLRALGHSADWQSEDIMKKAKNLGILKDISASENDSIIRGEVFLMMRNTLETNVNGTDETLAKVLGLSTEGSKPSGSSKPSDDKKNDVVVNNGEFKVRTVSATNLREIEIEFSQTVDYLTLRDAFHVQNSGLGKLEAKLGSSDNIVILTTEIPMKNFEEYKLHIKGARSTSKMEITSEIVSFKAEDKEYPEIEEVRVTGPKSLEIYFTEPINFSKSDNKRLELKLGSKKIHTSIAFDKSNERMVGIRLGSEMLQDREYELRTFGFMDFSGYPSKDREDVFTYQRDREAPVAEVLEATQEYVVVKFNKPVKGLRLDNFYHTQRSFQPYEAYASVEDLKLSRNVIRLSDSKSWNMLVLKFVDLKRLSKGAINTYGNYPLKSGKVDFYISGTSRTSGTIRIRDEWDNYFSDARYELDIPIDNLLPKVENASVKNEKELIVEFNKPILLDASNYEFYLEDKKIPAKAYRVLSDGSRNIKILFYDKQLVGKEVRFVIKDVVDATVNRLRLEQRYEAKIVFSDKSFAGVKEVIMRASESRSSKYYEEPTVIVYFEEPVENETATNSNNYRFLTNAKTPFKLDAYYYMPNDIVLEIRMSRQDYVDLFKGKNAKIILSENIKDKSGNGYDGFSMTYDILKNSRSKAPSLIANYPVSIKSDALTMELSFDEALFQNDYASVNTDMFIIKNKGKKLEIGDVRLDDKKIVIELNNYSEENKFPTDVSGLVVEFRNLNFENGGIGNVQGTIIENFIAKSNQIKDEIPPKLVKFRYADSEDIKQALYNQSNKSIELEYSEMLNENVLSALTYEVNYYNSYYDSEKLPVKMVNLDSSKKTVRIHLDYANMSESQRAQFDENVSVAASGGSSNMIYGTDKREYYPIFSIRTSEGNYVHDLKGNAAENEEVTIYIRK